MREFDSKTGYDSGAMERITAKIQDIKASPTSGKQRLVVREKGTNFTHAIIDIDMKVAKNLKEKETYIFNVNEKDDSSLPGFQRKRSSTFKAYHCEEAPDEYSASAERSAGFNRFGGGGPKGNGKRTKF
jgi:hypothetical protein